MIRFTASAYIMLLLPDTILCTKCKFIILNFTFKILPAQAITIKIKLKIAGQDKTNANSIIAILEAIIDKAHKIQIK